MKKSALLIAGENRDNRNDVEYIQSFLQSDFGGGWNPDEIKVFNNQSIKTSFNEWKWDNLDSDYLFIYYSGHGTIDYCSGHGTIDHIQIDAEFFGSNGNRMLVILDTCRTDDRTNQLPRSYLPPSLEKFSKINLEDCRRRYESVITDLPNGKIVVYSTQKGCVAHLDHSYSFGVFTIELLNIATAYFTSAVEFKNKPFLTIEEIVNATTEILKKKNVPQIPEIFTADSENLSNKIPFVINPYYFDNV